MSAAISPGYTPLFREGTEFWTSLTEECKRHVDAINAVVCRKNLGVEHCVRMETGHGPDIRIWKSTFPSTLIKLLIGFYSWGPMLSVAVTGQESEDTEFFPEEFEMPIAVDGDGSVIGIFDEGRSFSTRELAAYLTQNLRRCFPGVSLCC